LLTEGRVFELTPSGLLSEYKLQLSRWSSPSPSKHGGGIQ